MLEVAEAKVFDDESYFNSVKSVEHTGIYDFLEYVEYKSKRYE